MTKYLSWCTMCRTFLPWEDLYRFVIYSSKLLAVKYQKGNTVTFNKSIVIYVNGARCQWKVGCLVSQRAGNKFKNKLPWLILNFDPRRLTGRSSPELGRLNASSVSKAIGFRLRFIQSLWIDLRLIKANWRIYIRV